MDLSMIIGLVVVGVTIAAVLVAYVRRGRWARPAHHRRARDGAQHAGMFTGLFSGDGGGGFGGHGGGGCDSGGGGGCGGGSC